MLSKLIPIIFLVLGTGSGIGAAILTTGKSGGGHPDTAKAPPAETEAGHKTETDDVEYVRLNNQFVVPLVKGDRVDAMIVVSLSIEARSGMSEDIYSYEPKLRDLFLRVLFDHANMGGFRGAFTQSGTMDLLRTALREAAQKEMGDDIRDVLIVDIGRQDI